MREILGNLRYFYRQATLVDWLGLIVGVVLLSGGLFWYSYFGNLLGLVPAAVAVLIPIFKYLVFSRKG